MASNKTAKVSIRTTPEKKADFDKQSSEYETQHDWLVDAIGIVAAKKATDIPLEPEDIDDVHRALEIKGVSYEQFVRDTLVSEARKVLEQEKEFKSIEESIEADPITRRKAAQNLSAVNKAGFSEYRIEECVDALKRWNTKDEHDISDMWFINAGLVRALTRCNPNNAKAYFAKHRREIAEHHQAMGLSMFATGEKTRFNSGATYKDEAGNSIKKTNPLPSKKAEDYNGLMNAIRQDIGIPVLDEPSK